MGHHKHHKKHKGILSLLITAFILKIIWNALVPDLFGGPFISYLQSLLIILISRLIQGGGYYWGKRVGEKYDWEKKEWKEWESSGWADCGRGNWKEHFEAKWNQKEDEFSDAMHETEEEHIAKQEAAREKEEFTEGFTEGGRFDVNVVDVEDKTEEEEDEGKSEE
ncbi:MAG: hypothetical protein AAFY71_27785 [Bacteroidota bacterium]